MKSTDTKIHNKTADFGLIVAYIFCERGPVINLRSRVVVQIVNKFDTNSLTYVMM